MNFTHPNYATGVPDLAAPFGEVSKDTSYTIKPSESGKRFTNEGALGGIVFTLPAIAPGRIFEFVVVEDQSLTVATAEATGNMIAPDTVVGVSVAFASVGDKVGGVLQVESNKDGTKWITKKLSSNALTITT